MWPVIVRELRASARRWTTYWQRLLAALAVVIAVGWWLSSPNVFLVRQPGREIFLHMHRVIMAAIWIVVPLLTADCLSREKREGTLGLLFLTNLSARDIVFAKAAAAGLGALTLWLAVIPIITVPVLIGGLRANEIILSCLLALASIPCALAVGLLASAQSRQTSGAVALAVTLALFGHLVFLALVAVFDFFSPGAVLAFPFGHQWGRSALSSVFVVWNLSVAPAWAGVPPPGAAAPIARIWLLIPVAALVASCVVAFITAGIIGRNWQDKPKTKRQTEVENIFFAPVIWTSTFRRWMRYSLMRNPIGWLERRTWSGRISALTWLAIMISFASAVVSYAGVFRAGDSVLNGLMWMLLASIAYVAAGSFRRERETGALELILVTPLNERQIIFGRLRGLWGQFLPAFAVWVFIVMYLYSWQQNWEPANLVRFAIAYAVVPVVGLYFSLRTRFVLLSWVATLVVCFALPQILWWLLGLMGSILFFAGIPDWGMAFRFLPKGSIMTSLVQLALARWCLTHLEAILVRRSFVMR